MNLEELLNHRFSMIHVESEEEVDLLKNSILKVQPQFEVKLPDCFKQKQIGPFKFKVDKTMMQLLQENKAIKKMTNAEEYISNALEVLDIKMIADRYPRNLSLNQKERFSIIMDVAEGKKDFLIHNFVKVNIDYYMTVMQWLLGLNIIDGRCIFITCAQIDVVKNTIQADDLQQVITLFDYQHGKLLKQDITKDSNQIMTFDISFEKKSNINASKLHRLIEEYDVRRVYARSDEKQYSLMDMSEVLEFIDAKEKLFTILIYGKQKFSLCEEVVEYFLSCKSIKDEIYSELIQDFHHIDVYYSHDDIFNDVITNKEYQIHQDICDVEEFSFLKEYRLSFYKDQPYLINTEQFQLGIAVEVELTDCQSLNAEEFVAYLQSFDIYSAKLRGIKNNKGHSIDLLDENSILSLGMEREQFKNKFVLSIKGQQAKLALWLFASLLSEYRMITSDSYKSIDSRVTVKIVRLQDIDANYCTFKDSKGKIYLARHDVIDFDSYDLNNIGSICNLIMFDHHIVEVSLDE